MANNEPPGDGSLQIKSHLATPETRKGQQKAHNMNTQKKLTLVSQFASNNSEISVQMCLRRGEKNKFMLSVIMCETDSKRFTVTFLFYLKCTIC